MGFCYEPVLQVNLLNASTSELFGPTEVEANEMKLLESILLLMALAVILLPKRLKHLSDSGVIRPEF
jgi:hypothetical protein